MESSPGSRLSFADLRKGMMARIVAVPEGPSASRLLEMGLTEGATIRIVKVAPFGDPVEIDVRGYRLCLRRQEARDLQVEQIEEA